MFHAFPALCIIILFLIFLHIFCFIIEIVQIDDCTQIVLIMSRDRGKLSSSMTLFLQLSVGKKTFDITFRAQYCLLVYMRRFYYSSCSLWQSPGHLKLDETLITLTVTYPYSEGSILRRSFTPNSIRKAVCTSYFERFQI